MEESFVYSVLETTRSLLGSGGELKAYEENLSQLSKLVSLTGASNHTRDALVRHPFLHLSTEILTDTFTFGFKSEKEEELYIRNIRGLVLFVRNLSVETSSCLDVQKIALSIRRLLEGVDYSHSFFPICFQAYLQLIANFLTKESNEHIADEKIDSLLQVIDESTMYFIEQAESPDLKCPFNIILYNLFHIQEIGEFMLNSTEKPYFMDYIIRQGLNQMKDASFVPDLLQLLQVLITQDRFNSWLLRQKKDETFERILNLCQLIATSKEDWDSKESSAIIQWDFELFNQLADISIRLLTSEATDDTELSLVHSQLVRVLDIITHLCNYQTVQEFLKDNKSIEIFVSLLRATHENTEIKTPKLKKQMEDSEQDSLKIRKKNFPLVKSLIIETLAFLCHKSHTNQEQMRVLHGLELILSNCVIDEDNPYVKEHSILCLRFLLQDNQENQDFVALLEAKQVVDGEALTEAGYEVSIEDGKVRVKNSKA